MPNRPPLLIAALGGWSSTALAASERIELFDFYATLDDPSRPGTMRDAWTAEGDHPSLAGYRRLGQLAFRPF
jgi:hypothetical protein